MFQSPPGPGTSRRRAETFPRIWAISFTKSGTGVQDTDAQEDHRDSARQTFGAGALNDPSPEYQFVEDALRRSRSSSYPGILTSRNTQVALACPIFSTSERVSVSAVLIDILRSDCRISVQSCRAALDPKLLILHKPARQRANLHRSVAPENHVPKNQRARANSDLCRL